MPDIGTWLGQHWNSTEHAVSEDFRWFGELAEHAAHPYPQAPAPRQSQEETMSALTDAKDAVDVGIGNLEAASSRLAEAEANPLAKAALEENLGPALELDDLAAVLTLVRSLEAARKATQVMA